MIDTPALSVMYTNADAVTNKLHEIQALIVIHKPDIIAITEVKPKNLKHPLSKTQLKIDNYKLIPSETCFSSQGRGVCFYCHESIFQCCTEIEGIDGAESVYLHMKTTEGSTKIGCVYRSPNNSELNNDKLSKSFSDYSRVHQDEDIVIVGDFNFPEINWLTCSSEKEDDHPATKFLNSSLDGFMTQHVTEPTRWRDGQRSNTLDLIFTNRDGLISDVEILSPVGKSDHGILLFKVHCNFHVSKEPVHKRMWSRGDYQSMRRDFSIDWEQLLNGSNVEECWNKIKEVINCSRESCPCLHLQLSQKIQATMDDS